MMTALHISFSKGRQPIKLSERSLAAGLQGVRRCSSSTVCGEVWPNIVEMSRRMLWLGEIARK